MKLPSVVYYGVYHHCTLSIHHHVSLLQSHVAHPRCAKPTTVSWLRSINKGRSDQRGRQRDTLYAPSHPRRDVSHHLVLFRHSCGLDMMDLYLQRPSLVLIGPSVHRPLCHERRVSRAARAVQIGFSRCECGTMPVWLVRTVHMSA